MLLQLQISKTCSLPSLFHSILSWTSSTLPMCPENRVALLRDQGRKRSYVSRTRKKLWPLVLSMTFHIISISPIYSHDVSRQGENTLVSLLLAANLLMCESVCCSDWVHGNCEVMAWNEADGASVDILQWHTLATSDVLLKSSVYIFII